MTAPISCAIICKNDPVGLEQCLKSIRPFVQEIVCVDTGSTDNTPEVAHRYADVFEVYTGCNDAQGRIEDFSDARRRSLELATQPWQIWLDSDDELIGGEHLRSFTDDRGASLLRQNVMVLAEYDYAQDEHGNCVCSHWRERLVSNPKAFKWTSPIHEVLVPLEPARTRTVITDKFKIKHHRQRIAKVQEPGRNLRIIRGYMGKHGDGDPRLNYYRGLEECNAGNYREALRWHKLYVQRSGWDDEKALACLECAKIHQGLEEWDLAIEWALKAISVRETWCEPYFSLGRSHYALAKLGGHDAQRNWERCANFIRQGLALPPTRSILWVDPTDRAHHIHRVLNVALKHLGDTQGALDSCRIALSFQHADDLQVNSEAHEAALARQAIDGGVATLVRLGKLEPAAARSAASIVSGHYTIRRARAGAKDIVFFLGPAPEPWNPETLANGPLGGSEFMAYEMAKRLAAREHRVRVFAHCPGLEGFFDGVQYLDSSKFHGISCDLLIASRRPIAHDPQLDVSARKRWLWVHDIAVGAELTPDIATRLDRILVLSRWHREFFLATYPWLDERKVFQTRNGIVPEWFEGEEERNPHRAIYASSPDRGLQSWLDLWPLVRAKVPDAELHVFYGPANLLNTLRAVGDKAALAAAEVMLARAESMRDQGIMMRGRIPGKELAREFMRSGVWGAPTWFTETFCISAAEAQAGGCACVYTPIAALTETVGDAGVAIDGDWLDRDFQARFADAVVAAMLDTSTQKRSELSASAISRFRIDSLVDEWEKLL